MDKFMQRIGSYPAEYKPHIHGPFNPAINYKPDTPFKDVKLGELGKWFQRRNPNPVPAVSRAYWRYCQTWLLPKKASAAGLIQLILGASLFYYVMSYNTLSEYDYSE
ncbi:hypothetical protein LSH36_46g07089 [Paralvinella palmiformis]|uniref:ATP synthase subunit f, mitochondrial n=1 Tax=Paralvinella palmiformis TaxID=53620 RepID=A0AAD9K6J4_9ANNE|nr:hypothetical protein LSH36_46g07089 [Paralvinella palmiformis]